MYGDCTKSKFWEVRRVAVALFSMLLLSTAAFAQLEIGDNLKMTMRGDVGYGYTGSFGNTIQSNHTHGFLSNADLNGFYFHPNFINFNLHPFYDRNQSNSDSQFVTRGSGISAGMGFFSGSRFPGTITYGNSFASSSEFRIAGVPGVVGDSSGRNFGVSWSALVPDWPTLTASYTAASSESSVAGSDESSQNRSKSIMLTSGYTIAGFSLQGNLSHVNSDFETPSYLALQRLGSSSSATTYSASAGHTLPLHGSFSLGWSRSNSSTEKGDEWSSTNYTFSNSFIPWHRLSLYQNASYTTNLTAALSQAVVNGAYVSGVKSDNSSHGLYYSAGASYALGYGFNVGGYYNRRWQTLMGKQYEDSQYGGNVNYNHSSRLFGLLYFGIGVVDTASKMGNNGAGINTNVGLSRKFGRWDTSADFNYFQSIMTLGTIQATSNYSYGGSVRRRVNEDTQFGGSVRLAHSGMVVNEGSGNGSQSMSGFLGWKKYNFAGSYSQSSGSAVLTSTGELRPTPNGPIFTDDVMLFDATSWSVSGSTRLFRRISVTAGYSKFNSSTAHDSDSRINSGNRYNFRTEYRLRKFSFVGGFGRTNQEVSTIPGGPRVINSFYLSLSRWFNVF